MTDATFARRQYRGPMRRGLTLIAAIAACVAAAPAHASAGARFGIQDDAWLMSGPGTLSQRLAPLGGLGVRLVRFTVRWDQVAATQPTSPRDPADPAYDWGQFDVV